MLLAARTVSVTPSRARGGTYSDTCVDIQYLDPISMSLNLNSYDVTGHLRPRKCSYKTVRTLQKANPPFFEQSNPHCCVCFACSARALRQTLSPVILPPFNFSIYCILIAYPVSFLPLHFLPQLTTPQPTCPTSHCASCYFLATF